MSNSNRDVGLRMRDDIVAGVLSFGARITIDALATRYGTSHMPIREALRELQGEGLVVIEPNRGARVRTIDVDFVANLFEIRTALEVMLVRRAAERCTPRDITGLEAMEAVLEAHVAHGDYAGVVAENHRFHRTINLVAGNADALPIIDRHWMLLAALWRAHGYGAARFAGVANDHRNLIDALAAHDGEAASAIMGAHAAKAKLELMRRIAAHGDNVARERRKRRA
ncbi:MAG TPA: GntR family transcriptional regulator [Casimicrobiaceae bacterium]|jgi:DNA-binding GntR family transcriptional regulator|nr:GntR family transcriptional regulator [Casimicrobiaceae bacterium]